MSLNNKCSAFIMSVQLFAIMSHAYREPKAMDTEAIELSHNLEATANDLKEALYRLDVIPDVLESVPLQVVEVAFGRSEVCLGNKLNLLDIMVPPNRISWDYEKGSLYTLILSGPDFPNRLMHDKREYPHWAVGNIPEDSFSAGETLFEYDYPASSYHPGTHRFVFTLFKQNGTNPVTFDETVLRKRNIPLIRAYFSTQVFGRKYRMDEPIGVNFFQVDL